MKIEAKEINSLAEQINQHKKDKEYIKYYIEKLRKQKFTKKEFERRKGRFLKGKSEEEWAEYYNSQISRLLNEMEKRNRSIVEKTEETPESYLKITEKQRKEYIKELNINEEFLERLKPTKEETKKTRDYTLYSSSRFANIANNFVEPIAIKMTEKFPREFERLYHALRTSDIKILSKSYVGIMIFTSIIAFMISFLTLLFVFDGIILRIINSMVLATLTSIITFLGIYFYPSFVARSRNREIKNDLPFVVIHMSAVAGSGAQPISMFNLLLSSGEYSGLESEIKKIVNYVNLFGYDLSTALRSVALTTPSKGFSELLYGFVTTMESGGDLKDYLTSKGEDAMMNYRLERKKYVETLSTYSDIYTGVLIAAPLLFFVTLAIIQMLGGAIMGFSASSIAKVGVFGVLPVLNILFILFIDMIQPTT